MELPPYGEYGLTEAYAGSTELRFKRAMSLLLAADALHEEIQNSLEQLPADKLAQRRALLSLCERLIRNLARNHMAKAVIQWQQHQRSMETDA